MDELFQAEWCPFSHKVRQRYTELGVTYLVRQVPADSEDRDELRRRTGSDEIPALVLEDGTAISGDTDQILSYLDGRYSERRDAEEHRRRNAEEGGFRDV